MVYGIIFLIIGVAVFLLRRRLGIPLIVTIFGYFLISWWSLTIAQWLASLGFGKPLTWLQALVETLVILAVASFSIYKSTSTGRERNGRIVEAAVFALTIMVLLNGSLGYWFRLDMNSLDIKLFLVNYHKVLLTIAGVYALYEVLFRTE
ncbi:MAG: hypothetical protein ACOX0Z_00230 [Candidatus Nanosyncoccaceae bacterium]|jgi:hypothetical protein